MSYTIFPQTPPLQFLPSFRGLGALGATVPAGCWDKPAFKECNDRGWIIAERKCITEGLANRDYGGDWKRCKEVLASDYAYYGCALRICPPPVSPAPASHGGWVWASPTPNPAIKAFQDHVNTCLARNGYKPIAADGRMGPATCGAFKTVGGQCPDVFVSDPLPNLVICKSWLNPTKVGGAAPVQDPHSDEAKELDVKFGGLPWMVNDARVPPLQAGLNEQLTGHDMLPIAVTGRLDAPMCGGMRWLDTHTGSRWMPSWGQKCQAFVDPRRRPGAAPVGPTGPVGPVGPAPGPAPVGPVGPVGPAPAAKTSNAMMVAGGLLAAVAAGGYLWYKSKTGGA